ncbi:MAG: hypothetical protein CME65_09905 [Halobacteriovoraceae bacterium]|nr:hypothetical protein [Halobacteriovoraceae bacterium]|tara:strand:+ start:4359 stop:5240 length:882 start_codon:yes stop_codon:yes gene_type:complete
MKSKDQFLNEVDTYLTGLPAETKINLMSRALVDIDENPALLSEDSRTYADKVRSRHNYPPFKPEKKFSFFKLIFSLFAMFWVFVFLGLGLLYWKFTPIFKADEENQRVIILGGLIDIDGKSGKVKIFDQVQFADSDNLKDSFQMNMALGSEIDEVDLNFKSGQFTLKNSLNNELKFNCKLSGPFEQEMVEQRPELLKVNFAKLDGVTCELSIPEGKRILLEGVDSAINIDRPEFNTYIEVENGHVAILPAPERDYLFNLEVEQGYIGEFNSVKDNPEATEIQVRLQNGSIVTK